MVCKGVVWSVVVALGEVHWGVGGVCVGWFVVGGCVGVGGGVGVCVWGVCEGG